MNGYLDIHSHILPYIDDGAKSWDITKEMLIRAYQQGVRTIVATPHNYPNRPLHMEKVYECHEKTQKMAFEIASDFHVLLGNEIFFRESITQEIADGNILTMAGSDYLLVEFHPNEKYSVIFRGLKELTEHGYYPIIAHVERVNELVGKEERLEELCRMGCCMQANAQDFMGNVFNRSAARLRKLADAGYIHLLGSDCHNLTDRAPMMETCMELLKKKLSPKSWKKIAEENPEKFLAGKYI